MPGIVGYGVAEGRGTGLALGDSVDDAEGCGVTDEVTDAVATPLGDGDVAAAETKSDAEASAACPFFAPQLEAQTV